MAKFGPSGNSESFILEGHASTIEVPAWLKERNLDTFEYSFGRGVRITEAKAMEIGEKFREYDISISVHAPYYINLGSPIEENGQKSIGYILSSLTALRAFGGNRCVYHPAAQGKEDRETVVDRTIRRTEQLVEAIHEAGFHDMYVCPETMGKIGQIGTVDEVVRMCRASEILIPTLDFGHLNARTHGAIVTKDDYKREIDKLAILGDCRAKHFHVHFSKIEYSKGGEVRHLNFDDEVYGPRFEPFAEVMVEYDLHPTIVCESAGMQAEDAAYMKSYYEKLLSLH